MAKANELAEQEILKAWKRVRRAPWKIIRIRNEGSGHEYVAFDVKGFEKFVYQNGELKAVRSVRWTDFSQATVDHFWGESVFTFSSLEEKEKWVVQAKGRAVAERLAKIEALHLTVLPRPFWRKRKRVVASCAFVLVFGTCMYNANDGTTRNCDDFSTHQEAQAFYHAEGGPFVDPHGLDNDNDEIACEKLP